MIIATQSPRLLRHARASAVALGLLAALPACGRIDDLWAHAQSDPADTDASADDAQQAPSTAPSHAGHAVESPAHPTNAQSAAHAAPDGGALAPSDAAAAPDAVPDAAPPGPTVTAIFVWVPIYERMDTASPRLGYLRAGATVHVDAQPTGNDGCPHGWYAVTGGGYICLNRMTSLDPNALGARTPSQPDLTQPLPYTYMTTYRAAVMYRWLPSTRDMREVEPEHFGLPANSAAAMDGGLALAASDAGGGAMLGPAVLSTTAPLGASLSAGTPSGAIDAGPARNAMAMTVANRAQAEDAGVRLEDLQGEAGSPLLRRMLTGMYVSIDRAASSQGRGFWRSQNGGYVERGALSQLHNAPTFQGLVLDETHPGPLAFLVGYEAWTYDVAPDGHTVTRRERAPRLSVYTLTSDPVVHVGHNEYLRTTDGFYVNARNVRRVQTTAPPPDVLPDEKWIEVNLDRQMLIAYVGVRPVYATLVSTGRRNDSTPERNYETVQGAFRIQSKHIATTMDGNTAGDGPYSIEDVPWVMYFDASFALHGAFWHSSFGFMHSHGCVNMAPADARWIFMWSDPQLPPGWHGVYASAEHQGTRVYVHYDRQRLGEHGGPEVIPQH